MAASQAYCVKCRKTVDIKNPEQVTMKNGRPATKGVCPTCGTGVYRIGSGSGAEMKAGGAAASGGAKTSSAAKPTSAAKK